MTRPSTAQLRAWLANPAPVADLREQIRRSPTTIALLEAMRAELPDLTDIPNLTYTSYREFERTGSRPGYQTPYFRRRAMLARAVFEVMMGDDRMIDRVHDLAWSICEETSWVLPAHEEQGPDYWEINPPYVRTEPFGPSTALTREPEAIDLFAAETGASLAEVVHLVGDQMAPEVRQRIRQEVGKRIFKPYLARARDHWWFKGALNWNGVCNGSIGLAFLRLENDLAMKVQALSLVLEGFEAYIATGFEPDGGSIEGVGYWNYGLMYTITVAELLREMSGGELDLLSQPRLRDIAQYPPGMVLSPPDCYINFGDSPNRQELAAGVVNRLAERTGVADLRALLIPRLAAHDHTLAKFAIICRHAAWWDDTQPVPPLEIRDFYQPASGVIKLVGQTADGKTAILATKSGHNDGHHSHTDIGTFIVHIGDESLIADPGRGHYSKDYFRQGRYQNIFCNSYGHSVPRIDGRLQAPGPEFGGTQQFHGIITDHGQRGDVKYAVVDFAAAYDIPALQMARRTLELNVTSGAVELVDEFAFEPPLPVEEAFTTWFPVVADGSKARITGQQTTLELTVLEPAGAAFTVESLAEASRANEFDAVLKRLAVALPAGATRCHIRIVPM